MSEVVMLVNGLFRSLLHYLVNDQCKPNGLDVTLEYYGTASLNFQSINAIIILYVFTKLNAHFPYSLSPLTH